MNETFEIPDPVIEELEHNGVAIRAFREHSGKSAWDVSKASGIEPGRLFALEHGATATNVEIDTLSGVLGAPRDLLIDE